MSKKNPYKLTEKQFRFCEEYMIDLNATQASIRAGYSKKTANRIASQNLSKLVIQNFISELKNKTSERLEISHDMLTEEWSKIAFSSIAYLHNTWIERREFEELTGAQKECIESIDTKIVTEIKNKIVYSIEHVKIKLYDKTKALVELGKHTGYYEKDNFQKVPVSKIDYSKLTNEELIQLQKLEIKAIRNE